MKQLLCVLLSAMFLGVCGPVLAADYSPKDTVVYSHMTNVGPLNPHMYSPSQMFAQEMVYDPLVKLKTDGSIGPGLAERWSVSEDGLTYVFFLRKGVTFTDGQVFNAEAVVKNFETIMNNKARHNWMGIIDKIDRFEAVSPLEFKLVLKSPYYPCLEDLSLPRPFRMLSPASFPEDGDTSKGIKAPVGTGPWKLAESVLGEYDFFERNEDYWGDKPIPAKVLVKVIPDPISRAIAFESKEIDFIYGEGQINFDAFDRLRKIPGVEAKISGPMGTMAVALNSAVGPTKELAVRQALQYATDKGSIVRGVTLNTHPQADTYFSPIVPYCDLKLEPYPFDLEKAADILDKAEWKLPQGKKFREKDGQPLAIDFCFVGNNAAHKSIAEVMQAQAAAVGIKLNLLGEEADSYYSRQKGGDFGMILSPTWGPPFEPHAMVSSMLLPSHADYMAQIGLPMKAEIDAKIHEVMSAVEKKERERLYREILTTLHEQAVYLPIFYSVFFEAYRPDHLKNVEFGAGRTDIPFEKITLE
jgi:nickel transport system substrate-binding protein